MFDGYYNAFWFLVIGVIFVALNLWISSLIRPSDPHAEKLLPYECGEESSGTGFVRFNPRLYIIGLVFLRRDSQRCRSLYPHRDGGLSSSSGGRVGICLGQA